jgi:hypothetical protein
MGKQKPRNPLNNPRIPKVDIPFECPNPNEFEHGNNSRLKTQFHLRDGR